MHTYYYYYYTVYAYMYADAHIFYYNGANSSYQIDLLV